MKYLITLLLASCAVPLENTPPTAQLAPVSAPSPLPEPQSMGAALTPPTPTSTPIPKAPTMKLFTYEPWSLSITVPEQTTSDFDTANHFLNLHPAYKQDIQCKRVDAPPPTKLSQTPKGWSWGNERKVLDEGVSPSGTVYQIVTIKVRVGVGGIDGEYIHRIETVSLGYAAIPVNKKQYIECTYSLEFDIENDPTLASTKALLLSIVVR